MFENIVIGVKVGQPHAKLIELARSAAPTGAKVHLVTMVRVGKDGDEPQRREQATSALEHIAESLRADGYEVSTEVALIGVAAGHELLRIAEQRDADLIAIGLGKRSRVGKALLGGDAQAVILGAECAVLSAHLDV